MSSLFYMFVYIKTSIHLVCHHWRMAHCFSEHRRAPELPSTPVHVYRRLSCLPMPTMPTTSTFLPPKVPGWQRKERRHYKYKVRGDIV